MLYRSDTDPICLTSALMGPKTLTTDKSPALSPFAFWQTSQQFALIDMFDEAQTSELKPHLYSTINGFIFFCTDPAIADIQSDQAIIPFKEIVEACRDTSKEIAVDITFITKNL